jgi:hypothetical protein
MLIDNMANISQKILKIEDFYIYRILYYRKLLQKCTNYLLGLKITSDTYIIYNNH